MTLSKQTIEDMKNAYNEHKDDTGKLMEILNGLAINNTENPRVIAVRMGQIRSFFKKEFNMDIKFDDYDKYDKLRRDINERVDSMQQVVKYPDTIIDTIAQLEDLDLPDSAYAILGDTSIKHSTYKAELMDVLYNMIIYNMWNTGRRISEILSGFEYIDDKLFYHRLKTSEKRLMETPVLDTSKIPIIIKYNEHIKKYSKSYTGNNMVSTITTRINKYIKKKFGNYSSHDLRKIASAYFSSKVDTSKRKSVYKVKDFLGHVSIESSERYNCKITKMKTCKICDVSMLSKNFNRHLLTSKHKKKSNQ